MFDRIDAAVYHLKHNATYFFRKREYLKFVHGEGVQNLGGSKVRRIGVDGWDSLPEQFRSNIDAVLSYSNDFLYFFKGANYVKWKPEEGVEATGSGEKIRTIGVTGWTSFPFEYRSGIDAAFYYPVNGHAYFFKDNTYIKYKPGEGVVKHEGKKIRQLGLTGWKDIPHAFMQGMDAALYYPPNGKLYFFRNREYVRWEPEKGVAPRYPRRLGLQHRGFGGWPGLSTLIGGPLTSNVTFDSATIWLWLTGGKSTDDIMVRLNNAKVMAPEFLSPNIGTETNEVLKGVNAVDQKSMIRLLRFQKLTSNTMHHVELLRADDQQLIEQLVFKTAPRPEEPMRIRVGLGSCANHTQNSTVDTFLELANKKLDFLILCGDNCYYFRNDLSNTNPRPDGSPLVLDDWGSVTKMLTRQLEARNHPQFLSVARTLPVFSTWDDHDFGYNNCDGEKNKDDPQWVGRACTAGVYRLMWNHPYRQDGNHIYYDFPWGPLHVFVTDGRFHSNRSQWILGTEQVTWLLAGLKSSDAPIKIIVFGSQFISTTEAAKKEGFAFNAEKERNIILDTIENEVHGPVLIFSGDVHFSECQRYPEGSKSPKIVEVTSSPLRVTKPKPEQDLDRNRLWHTVKESFAVVDINFLGVTNEGVNGSVLIEAYDKNGEVLSSLTPPGKCRTSWDLLSSHLSLDSI